MMPILPMLCNHFPRSRPRMATSVMPAITAPVKSRVARSEEHTSELQSRSDLVCRLLLEKKKKKKIGVEKVRQLVTIRTWMKQSASKLQTRKGMTGSSKYITNFVRHLSSSSQRCYEVSTRTP